MKDRTFSGRDVAEAVASAAETLGLPAAAIRYFVLEPGRPGGMGVTPTPARIAVLMEAHSTPPRALQSDRREVEDEARHGEDEAQTRRGAGFTPAERRGGPGGVRRSTPPLKEAPETELHRLVRALGVAADLEITAEVLVDRESWMARITTAEPAFLLGEDGGAEVLQAFEHLLHRSLAPAVFPLKLKVDLAGHRERRDDALRARAQALIDEVKSSGQPRSSPALNAYERRIVHMVAAIAGGVTSQSEGEGAGRRVVIAPAREDHGPSGEVF